MRGRDDTERESGRLDIWRAELRKKEIKGKLDFFEFIKHYND